MKLFIFLCMLFILFGCAGEPLTPEQQYAREDALVIEREEFWIRYDRCLRRGGAIIFDSLGRIRRPSKMGRRPDISIWEMRSATCGIKQ